MAIPQDLRGCHAATHQLGKLLDDKPFGDPPMHVVRGREHTVIRVAPESKRRALLALDGLFRALVARGHEVRLKRVDEAIKRHAIDLHVIVQDEPVGISLLEKSGQRPHVLTREEAEPQRRSPFAWSPTYDRFTTGVLSIELDRRRYGSGARFADGKKQRLEDRLGHVVLAIEDHAEAQRLERHERKLAAQRAEVERQRREAERRQEEYMVALGNDLLQMTVCWREAESIRTLLEALETRLHQDQRTTGVTAWLTWARAFADGHDPLTRPDQVPNHLTSD